MRRFHLSSVECWLLSIKWSTDIATLNYFWFSSKSLGAKSFKSLRQVSHSWAVPGEEK